MTSKLPYNNVIITILSAQTVHGSTESSELTTVGHFECDEDGAHILSYYEYLGSSDGTADTLAVLTVSTNGTVSFSRIGNFATELFFEQGTRYNSAYTTPYGTMNLGVYTKTVSFTQSDEDTAEILLEYSLDSGADVFSDNSMKFIIKKRNEKDDQSE